MELLGLTTVYNTIVLMYNEKKETNASIKLKYEEFYFISTNAVVF